MALVDKSGLGSVSNDKKKLFLTEVSVSFDLSICLLWLMIFFQELDFMSITFFP